MVIIDEFLLNLFLSVLVVLCSFQILVFLSINWSFWWYLCPNWSILLLKRVSLCLVLKLIWILLVLISPGFSFERLIFKTSMITAIWILILSMKILNWLTTVIGTLCWWKLVDLFLKTDCLTWCILPLSQRLLIWRFKPLWQCLPSHHHLLLTFGLGCFQVAIIDHCKTTSLSLFSPTSD